MTQKYLCKLLVPLYRHISLRKPKNSKTKPKPKNTKNKLISKRKLKVQKHRKINYFS